MRIGHACHLVDALSANSTLRVLRLQDNPLGERGAKALVESLPHNTNVKDLYLPRQYIDMIRISVVYSRVSSRVILYGNEVKCVYIVQHSVSHISLCTCFNFYTIVIVWVQILTLGCVNTSVL